MESEKVVLDAATEVFEPNKPMLLKDVIVVPVYVVALMVPFTSKLVDGLAVFIPTFPLVNTVIGVVPDVPLCESMNNLSVVERWSHTILHLFLFVLIRCSVLL